MTASSRVSKSRAKRLEGGAKRVEVILDERVLADMAAVRKAWPMLGDEHLSDADIIRAALRAFAVKLGNS